MKKHTYLIFTMLELLALGGAWAVRHFTRRKMGMMRFVAHESRQLEAALPMESIRLGCAVTLAALLLAAVLFMLLRRRQLSPGAWLVSGISVLLTLAALCFVLANSRETLSYYYFICPLLFLAALFQFGKAVLVLRKQK